MNQNSQQEQARPKSGAYKGRRHRENLQKRSTFIPITDQLSAGAVTPLITGWRAWIIKKLGGHVLTGEERTLLVMHLWLPRFEKQLSDNLGKETARILENSFTTNYTNDEKE